VSYKKKGLKIGVFIIFGMAIMSGIIMLLWNWLVPALFTGMGSISYIQALGLLALSRILFSGFHGRREGCHGHHHSVHWGDMNDEEHKYFKEKIRDRYHSRHSRATEGANVPRDEA
jgi:hypothetical protein